MMKRYKLFPQYTEEELRQASLFKSCIDTLEEEFSLINVSYDIPRDLEEIRNYEKMLSSTRKDDFDADDRYVVFQLDLDLYLPHVPYSINTFNLARAFQSNNICLSRLIIIARGGSRIDEEFNLLSNHSKPTVIKSDRFYMEWGGDGTDDLDIGKIERHAISLMKAPRVHRAVLYDAMIKNKINDRIAIRFR